MEKSLAVVRSTGPFAEYARAMHDAMVRPLLSDAELWLFQPSHPARAIGLFQRAIHDDATRDSARGPLVRRVSGGPTLDVAPGVLIASLVMPHVSSLTPCDPSRILNRYVRPTLRALTKMGALSHYFGRDWIAVKHRPAGAIVYAHDAASGKTIVETYISLAHSVWKEPREAFREKEPAAIADLFGRAFDEVSLSDAIAEAHARAFDCALVNADRPALGDAAHEEVSFDPPWRATVEESCGRVAAGPDARGRFRIGGDFMASSDVIKTLERGAREQEEMASETSINALVERCFGARSHDRLAAHERGVGAAVALDGVRSLRSVVDVMVRARSE